MTEQDIMIENGSYWVGRDRQAKQYVVYKVGVTHSVADSAYPLTDDGLSIAVYRCNYLARRECANAKV